MNEDIKQWIHKLQLQPHPEGGYYREVIKAPYDNKIQRSPYTSIYFLIIQEDISHFHRIDSDEIWYYHSGDSLTVHMIFEDGQYQQVSIGPNIESGDVLQYVVPKGTIFASSIEGKGEYALVGCMCQPGFEFESFEMISKEWLDANYRQHSKISKRYALTQAQIDNI
ncbi:cupin domain-containing protein [Staphylococcus sp. Marseille-Q5304]|uniref:cupin domain-containing protein n=1 Tax=Staphylococcus sp. Marseille-Q5304 TaxID=2942200 RepID=UPI0020737249|nr:cupin domain-containing protein [Staphylococcus sp. Marseille-Q5304]